MFFVYSKFGRAVLHWHPGKPAVGQIGERSKTRILHLVKWLEKKEEVYLYINKHGDMERGLIRDASHLIPDFLERFTSVTFPSP